MNRAFVEVLRYLWRKDYSNPELEKWADKFTSYGEKGLSDIAAVLPLFVNDMVMARNLYRLIFEIAGEEFHSQTVVHVLPKLLLSCQELGVMTPSFSREALEALEKDPHYLDGASSLLEEFFASLDLLDKEYPDLSVTQARLFLIAVGPENRRIEVNGGIEVEDSLTYNLGWVEGNLKRQVRKTSYGEELEGTFADNLGKIAWKVNPKTIRSHLEVCGVDKELVDFLCGMVEYRPSKRDPFKPGRITKEDLDNESLNRDHERDLVLKYLREMVEIVEKGRGIPVLHSFQFDNNEMFKGIRVLFSDYLGG